MENTSNGKSMAIIIELIQRIIQLGFEYLTNMHLIKAKNARDKIVKLAVWFLGIWMLSICSYLSLMGIGLIYLVSIGISSLWALVILFTINILLLIFALSFFCKAKKDIF